jgi:outer membrane protein OmpA-like peptidoglycan-associated protein
MPNRPRKDSTKRGTGLKIVRRDGSTRPLRRDRLTAGPGHPRFPLIIEFGRGIATPGIESVTALYGCGQWLATRGGERVSVVGHANKRLSEKTAAALARARVATVTSLLLLFGANSAQVAAVATPRLHTAWLGSTRAERLRRRIVVIFRHEPLTGARQQVKRSGAGGGAARRLPRKRAGVR